MQDINSIMATKPSIPPLGRFISPVNIEFSEEMNFQGCYCDLNNHFDRTNASKLRLIVEDTTGKTYRAKWIRLKKITKSTGPFKEIAG